jgi:hypothetical protein
MSWSIHDLHVHHAFMGGLEEKCKASDLVLATNRHINVIRTTPAGKLVVWFGLGQPVGEDYAAGRHAMLLQSVTAAHIDI